MLKMNLFFMFLNFVSCVYRDLLKGHFYQVMGQNVQIYRWINMGHVSDKGFSLAPKSNLGTFLCFYQCLYSINIYTCRAQEHFNQVWETINLHIHTMQYKSAMYVRDFFNGLWLVTEQWRSRSDCAYVLGDLALHWLKNVFSFVLVELPSFIIHGKWKQVQGCVILHMRQDAILPWIANNVCFNT